VRVCLYIQKFLPLSLAELNFCYARLAPAKDTPSESATAQLF